MANKPNDENEKELTKEEMIAKEKKFSKLFCPYCGTQVKTLTEPCPTCEEIMQAEKRNSLN